MIRRRWFIGASLGLAAMPAAAQERPIRFSVTGSLEQGSLAMGSAPPGSVAALDGRPLRILADGRFAFGFGPNQTAASVVTVRYPDGGGDSKSFTPSVRKYDVQRVNGLPQNTVTPPPEVTARIAREVEEVFLARVSDTPGSDIFRASTGRRRAGSAASSAVSASTTAYRARSIMASTWPRPPARRSWRPRMAP